MYAKVMERKRDVGAEMDKLVRGADWARTGTNPASVAYADIIEATKNPA
jgi:hypothetical protein